MVDAAFRLRGLCPPLSDSYLVLKQSVYLLTMIAMAEKLSGVIERIVFHNPENGFGVMRVEADGRRGLVTLVGTLPSAVAGEYIEATGACKQDRDHGLQFKADNIH